MEKVLIGGLLLTLALLSGCGGPLPLTDKQLSERVRAVARSDAQCSEFDSIYVVNCGIAAGPGKVAVYVLNTQKNTFRVDYDMNVAAPTQAMLWFTTYMREIMRDFNVTDKNFRDCVVVGDGRKTSSFRVSGYDVECATYMDGRWMKSEIKLTRR